MSTREGVGIPDKIKDNISNDNLEEKSNEVNEGEDNEFEDEDEEESDESIKNGEQSSNGIQSSLSGSAQVKTPADRFKANVLEFVEELKAILEDLCEYGTVAQSDATSYRKYLIMAGSAARVYTGEKLVDRFLCTILPAEKDGASYWSALAARDTDFFQKSSTVIVDGNIFMLEPRDLDLVRFLFKLIFPQPNAPKSITEEDRNLLIDYLHAFQKISVHYLCEENVYASAFWAARKKRTREVFEFTNTNILKIK